MSKLEMLFQNGTDINLKRCDFLDFFLKKKLDFRIVKKYSASTLVGCLSQTESER